MLKPKKVTIEGEHSAERSQRALCDQITIRACQMMHERVAAPIPMIVDRLLTHAVGQAVLAYGKDGTVRMLKQVLLAVENGVFASLSKKTVD